MKTKIFINENVKQVGDGPMTATAKHRMESLWLILFYTLCDPAFIRVISETNICNNISIGMFV